jgi:exodeoxyribonuclease VII large subunit
VLRRKSEAAAGPQTAARRKSLEHTLAALSAHDPRLVLARGYAMVEQLDGKLITAAQAAHEAKDLRIRFSDGIVPARVTVAEEHEQERE